MKILAMSKEEILQLDPDKVDWRLSAQEVVHIATTLDAFWGYDYQAAENGKPGFHALLKSGLHSDTFFISRIMLARWNIRLIMARQMMMELTWQVERPVWVAGVPDGATGLGEDLAAVMGSKVAKLEKKNGKILLVSKLPPGESLLLCEDFCTRGTGFKEAALDIHSKSPGIEFVFLEPVIINRGGLSFVVVEGVGIFRILPVVNIRINDWPKDLCPLCNDLGSIPIKPKETDENWRLITTAQR